MKYAELFAGAGGLSLGLEAAGFHAVAHAEIEPHARAVLRYRWPHTRLDGDVTKVNGADYAGITLLSGGSPCQDLSVAGKRAGLTGSRSSLFHEQCRIWRESGAPYLLWENVLGALSSNNGADFATVLSTIVGSTVAVPATGWRGGGGVVAGRDAVAAWRVLDLQHFGPPQRRVRVFVLAARTGGVDPAEVLALSEGVCGHPSPRQQSREGVAARARGGAESGVAHAIKGSVIGRNDDAGSQRSMIKADGMFCLQTGEVHAVIAWDNELNASKQHAVALNISNGVPSLDDAMGTLDCRAGGSAVGAQTRGVVLAFDTTQITSPANYSHPKVGDPCHPLAAGAHPPAVIAFHTTQDPISGDVSPAIGRPTDGMGVLAFSLMPQNSGKDYTGREVQVLQPLHTGGTGAASNQGGDVIVCTTGDVTHALTHEGADASEDGTGRGTPIVARMLAFGEYTEDGMAGAIKARDHKDATDLVYAKQGRPRRLTPLECERLMSWPDQWTATGRKDDGTDYALSDTARYRLCGNGVGSVCAEWIGKRLAAAIMAQGVAA